MTGQAGARFGAGKTAVEEGHISLLETAKLVGVVERAEACCDAAKGRKECTRLLIATIPNNLRA